MSYISPQGEASTTAEIALLAALNTLAITPSGKAIAKTGIASFANATFDTSIASADGSITVTNPTTTVDLAVVSSPKLTTARTINTVSFDGTANITVTAAAGTLTGTTLNATVVTSSLTTIGTLIAGAVPASLVTAGTFGTGAYVMNTSLTNPILIGGTTTTSTLTLRSTSGVGIAGADIIFQTGNNGATEAMRILNSGNVGIGTTVAGTLLTVGTAVNTPGSAFNGKFNFQGGTLGAVAGNVLKIGDFSFDTGASANHAGLGISAVRTANGTDWTTTAVKFGYDVDNSDSIADNILVLTRSGNVGIGTTSPASLFSVAGNGYFTGNVGIGTANPGVPLQVDAAGASTIRISRLGTGVGTLDLASDATNAYISSQGAALPILFRINNVEKVRIDSNGNVGIGTTSPWRVLSVTGTVGFDGLTGSTGAGSLCLDANKQVVYNSGSDACLSSTRSTKHDIQSLTIDSIDIITKLVPVSFVYNQGDGRTRYGFIAEDTAALAASLATYDAKGDVSGIDDRAILSVVVKAIKELDAKLVALTAQIKDIAVWFAGGKFTVQSDVCVDNVCVTKEKFKEMLQNAGASGSASVSLPVPASVSAPTSVPAPEPTATTTATTPATVTTTAATTAQAPATASSTPSEMASTTPADIVPTVIPEATSTPAIPATTASSTAP